MNDYTSKDFEEALQVITITIANCEKMVPKFAEGTSQHTLLKNRINALLISKALVMGENVFDTYTEEDLSKALPPVSSIISKCEKAQLKFVEGTGHHTRLEKIIQAMTLSKILITDALNQKNEH